MSGAEASDAASLILFAPPAGAGNPPRLLMIERGAALAFAGGALAFPGGRVDPSDVALALAAGDAGLAPAIAAIRETIEETGVATGVEPPPDEDGTEALRAGIGGEGTFAAALATAGLRLAPGFLAPFARWLPSATARRRFDTRFYIAELAAAIAPRADGSETASAFWTTAADALAGGRPMLFPTRRILERLATFADFAAARSDAAARPEAVVTPHIEERDGERWLCVPEGLGYPVTAERVETALRR